MNALVRKLDHIFVPGEDPASLFTLFTETLGLPAAWPLHDYGMMRSGGVCFGNANVEFVEADPGISEHLEPSLPVVIRGLAFEPEPGADVIAELDARGLPHTPPAPHEGTGARGDGLLWTNVYLGGMIGRAAIVFLCDYAVEEALRHDAGARALDETSGGPIGIQSIDEVVVGATQPERALARWGAFLAPHEQVEPGVWRPGDGPAIRVGESPKDGAHGFAVKVRSLEAAREALAGLGLLGPVKKRSIGLHYPATHGLDVWFVE